MHVLLIIIREIKVFSSARSTLQKDLHYLYLYTYHRLGIQVILFFDTFFTSYKVFNQTRLAQMTTAIMM